MKKTIYVYERESAIYKDGPQLAVRIHETKVFNEPLRNVYDITSQIFLKSSTTIF